MVESPPDGTAERLALEAFLVEGDEAAFVRLHRAVAPYLWGFAMRLSAGDAAEAEELVQEAWARAIERLGGFHGASRFRSWLAGFVLNCWRERRRELRWIAEQPAEATPERREPATAPDRLEVERALAALPDGSRAVLVLFELFGHGHDEIARRLGIPAGTSKRRLFDARRALRRRLGVEKETV